MMDRFSRLGFALALALIAVPPAHARECEDEDPLDRVKSLDIELLQEVDVSKCGDKASVAFHEGGIAACGVEAKRDVLERSAFLRVPKPSDGTIAPSHCRLSPDFPHYGFYPALVGKQIRFGSVADAKCPGAPTVVDYRALEPPSAEEKRVPRESAREDSLLPSKPSTFGSFRKSFGSAARVAATCEGEKPAPVLGKESPASAREPAGSKRSKKK